jgi:signal-transduction protein with cAMP-binding, CBS, and nucleotidyltransferase domain
MALDTLLKKKLISCQPDSSIKKVAEMMDEENVGAVLVVEDGEPRGIITDRDIVVRCVVNGMDCMKGTAKEIMTEPVECVGVRDGIFDVVETMKDKKVRRIPVVDDDGKAVGLISFGDVFQLLSKEIEDLAAPTVPEKTKIVEQAA